MTISRGAYNQCDSNSTWLSLSNTRNGYVNIFWLYRDIFLTLNIAHTYSLCSILKNENENKYLTV
jgi:hypothetical protein